jgi:hypothetical protein
MILHEQPHVAPPRQQGRAQPPVGEQFAAEIFRQDADRLMSLDQRSDHANIVGDAARAVLKSPRLQKPRLRDGAEIVRIGANERLDFAWCGGFDQEQPKLDRAWRW